MTDRFDPPKRVLVFMSRRAQHVDPYPPVKTPVDLLYDAAARNPSRSDKLNWDIFEREALSALARLIGNPDDVDRSE
jgi:hypothetical protein